MDATGATLIAIRHTWGSCPLSLPGRAWRRAGRTSRVLLDAVLERRIDPPANVPVAAGATCPPIIPIRWRASMNSLLAVSNDPFELDVQIVTEGPVAAALLADTDDGCDTVKGSDC